MNCIDKVAINIKGKIYFFPCGKCPFCREAKKRKRKKNEVKK